MDNNNFDTNKISDDRREIARENGLRANQDNDFGDKLDQYNDSLLDDEGDDTGPTFSAENEALSRYETLQHPDANTTEEKSVSNTPHDFTKQDADVISEGIKEAGVIDPHRGEVGRPEPKHHMDHM